MKSELSSLLDDELESDRRQAVLTVLCNDAEVRTKWCEYHLIGDALRRTPQLDIDLTARVMAGLQHEPAILAPQPHTARREVGQGVMRYAAAVAGVAAVAWLALSGPTATQPATQHAQQTLARMVVATQPEVQPGNSSRMQAYLVAHQAYSPSNRFDGGAGYIRTVAAIR